MTQTKTKKALLMSVLSMVLCVAMLVGMTFAWFTDTASTGVNTIQAGTLKVDIVDATEHKSIQNTGLKFASVDGKKGEEILWEPGATYRTEGFQIKNNGNLALKYKLQLNGITGNSELLEVIKFSIVKADGSAIDLNTFEGNLTPENDASKLSEVLYIQGNMDKDAGNKYQGMRIDGIGITVVATQMQYEKDSISNEYDKDATYPTTIEDIKKNYSADGLRMPAGVEVAKDPDATNGHFVITLKDEEAFIYFTQVFNRKAALAARTEALNNGTATRYEGESTHNSLNIWYYENAVTLKMGCDIDLKGATVNPFTFGGIYFDGNGHTIKNAKLTATSGDLGFFTRGATVKNVVFDNIQVTATGCDSAGVAVGSTNTNITNVTVKNSSVTGAKYTGAVVGYNYGSVTNCTVENTKVSGQYKVGGIIGFICADSGKSVDVTDNKLTDVTVEGENLLSGKDKYIIGKIVGNWNSPNGNCKDNMFTGTTTATEKIGKIESGCTVTQ